MDWFVRTFCSSLEGESKVLDVGSYDVNGCYKTFFSDEKYVYTGLDMSSGPNVDLVPKNPYNWVELPDNAFDIVISGQALEHIEFFWVTVAEMTRVLKKGGLLCIIAPRGFERHRYPVDCYRFDADGMLALARYCNLEPLHVSTNLAPRSDMYQWFSDFDADSILVAKKPVSWEGMLNVKEYVFKDPDLDKLATGFVSENKMITAKIKAAKGLR